MAHATVRGQTSGNGCEDISKFIQEFAGLWMRERGVWMEWRGGGRAVGCGGVGGVLRGGCRKLIQIAWWLKGGQEGGWRPIGGNKAQECTFTSMDGFESLAGSDDGECGCFC